MNSTNSDTLKVTNNATNLSINNDSGGDTIPQNKFSNENISEETATGAGAGAASDWPVEASSYNILGKVGRGAFATVYKASSCPSQKPCAIKVINLEHVDTNFVDIRLEVQTMRLSMNENVLACHTSFIHHTNLWLVMHLMDKGSSLRCLQDARILYNPLNRCSDDDLNAKMPKEIDMEKHITYILHETILGLKYIHDNGQIHRDIKAGNILLDSNGNVRIADFGVSGWLDNAGSQRENTRTFVGTPCWMAPEVMEQIHGYDTKADIWSLGITALELAKGFAPYAKYPPMKVLLLTIQEDPPSLDTYENDNYGELGVGGTEEKWSKSFQSMITMCLQKDPTKRPHCEELLNHDHFRALQDESERLSYKDRIKNEICDLIPNVGDDLDGTERIERNKNVQPATATEESVPEGTTWIFNYGSHVSASKSSEKASHDKTEDFFDEFEQATQGEHFKHPSSISEQPQPRTQNDQGNIVKKPERKGSTAEEENKADLNAFMDQFEKETGGENFKHSS